MHQVVADGSIAQSDLGYTAPPTAPWYTSSRVFRFDGLVDPDGGSDWFEGAVLRPDKVLREFNAALYPSLQVRSCGRLPYGNQRVL